jgi:acyl carrier protein
MNNSQQEIESGLRKYIISEFLPDEDEEDLTSDVELINTGILDSISVISIVAHMESVYEFKIEAHEASLENMNTIASMRKLVQEKISATS